MAKPSSIRDGNPELCWWCGEHPETPFGVCANFREFRRKIREYGHFTNNTKVELIRAARNGEIDAQLRLWHDYSCRVIGIDRGAS